MTIFKQGNLLQNHLFKERIILCLEDERSKFNDVDRTCLCLSIEGKIFEKQIIRTLSIFAWDVIAQIK